MEPARRLDHQPDAVGDTQRPMPARAALIGLLMLDRPLCLLCLAERSGLPSDDALEYLTHMRGHIAVFHDDSDRCRACGVIGKVFSLARVSAKIRMSYAKRSAPSDQRAQAAPAHGDLYA